MRTSDLGDRSAYLGATDIAAIVGLSQYRAPIDVWREKRGEATFTGNTATEWGLRLEEAICEGYTAQTGRRLIRRNELVVRPYIRFHPDRFVIGEPGVFDAKSGMDRTGYGEPGTDQVPPNVRVQGVLYVGASKREWIDFAHLGSDVWRKGLPIYRVPADPVLYEWLIAQADEWWQRHIVEGIEPEPDGTEAYRKWLSVKYPHDVELEMVATADQQLLMEELADLRAQKAEIEKTETAIGNRLADQMVNATVMVGPAGKCTFRPSVTPRWKQIAEEIANEAMLDPKPFVERDTAGRALPSFRFYPAKSARDERAAA